MDKDYQVVYVEKPEEAAWGVIGNGLDTFNTQIAGDYKFQRVCFALQSNDQVIVGGVLGELFWDWFHIDLLWIPEELRGKGYGKQLLAQIETEAKKRGAKNIFLDTFSFQAPDFYIKHGYHLFGELKDFPPGHQRYFFTKQL